MEANFTPPSFCDFPEDVQLCILSFLNHSELSSFASTSKHNLSLCRNDSRLWFAICNRRWGSKTQILKWGSGKIPNRNLYRILNSFDNLIGFWRGIGDTSAADSTSLVFFQWGPSYITGSRILPSGNSGYGVIKKRFLWISVNEKGEEVSYVDPDGSFEKMVMEEEGFVGELESELIRVQLGSIGDCHMVVEECSGISEFGFQNVYGSPPDKLTAEIYQYFANKTSPGGNGSSRRQRRREKERLGKWKKWEPEHLVKIVNYSPSMTRPLQGLWKGICDDTSLDFYLVFYDDIGGIACRKIMASNRPVTLHAPVFWGSSTTFTESPLSPEEDHIYCSRTHLQPHDEAEKNHERIPFSDIGYVSGMFFIKSSFDLFIPDLTPDDLDPRKIEGRVWQYGNGTFGFGFLRDSYIIDMKPIAKDGRLLDLLECSTNS